MKIKATILFAAAALTFTACNDWFDVTSSNEVREADHYSTDAGFQQVLTGCYIAMAEDALYGKNLSWYVPVLAANETTSFGNYGSTSTEYAFQSHNYANQYARPVCENIWAKAYSVIANANAALAKIDGKQQEMNTINYHVVKGELLAVRAFMHFQLLRLYGYGNWSSRKAELDAKATVPYVTTVTKEITEQPTGAQFVKLLVADLTAAADLLKDYDPVCGTHEQSYYDEVNDAGYYNNRNSRLNYYAVKALLAQVYLWEGSAASINLARQAAEEVIAANEDGNLIAFDGQNTYIMYMLDAQTLNSSNAIMAPEMLFGLKTQSLDVSLSGYVKANYADFDYGVFRLTNEDAATLFDDPETADVDETGLDIRFSNMLTQNQAASSTSGFALTKFSQESLNAYNKNKVPVIRLPEVYLIAAECYARASQPNLEKAADLLTAVRQNRGLYTPVSSTLTADEFLAKLQDEYRREFIGEGEVFYFYKRTGALTMPRHDELTDDDYLLPYPEFEVQAGRVQ